MSANPGVPRPGERVLIREGTFASMQGDVVAILGDPAASVEVRVEIFGRPIPMQLEPHQFYRIDAMSESEYLHCADTTVLLAFLRHQLDARRSRLFAVACCRSIAHLLTHGDSQQAVEVAEGFAEGQVTEEQRRLAAWQAQLAVYDSSQIEDAGRAAADAIGDERSVPHAAACAARAAAASPRPARTQFLALFGEPRPRSRTLEAEQARQCHFLRDLCGNPFRPVTFDPTWLVRDVLALATAVREEGRHTDLPILADALEDAGCADLTLLEHCRQGAPHCHGCWAVDLVLGAV